MITLPLLAARDRGLEVALEYARVRLVSVFAQRCVYLFVALLVLIVMVPFFEDSVQGRIALNIANVVILIAASVAVSHSPTCFTLAVALGATTIGCQFGAIVFTESHLLPISRASGAAFYFLTVCYLLTYVFRNEVLTLDKLYGAASAFLMLGMLWGYFYLIALHFYPGSLVIGGAPLDDPPASAIIYYSFTVLTTTGFGDIVAVHPVARMLCALEQVVGVLFIAILIARLAVAYPQPEKH
jgi:hypothetical protein